MKFRIVPVLIALSLISTTFAHRKGRKHSHPHNFRAKNQNSTHSSKQIRDLMFFPEQGTYSSQTGLTFLSSSVDISGVASGDADNSEVSFSQKVSYAFTKNIDAGIELNFASSETEIDATIIGKSKTNDSGLTNPELFLRYQFLNGSNEGQNLHFNFALAPNIGNKEAATASDDGNNLSGNTQINLEIEYGKKVSQTHEWSTAFSLRFNTSGTAEDATTGAEEGFDSSLDFFISGAYQYSFDSKQAVLASLGLIFLGDEKTDDGSKTKNDPSLALGFGYSYQFNDANALGLTYALTQQTSKLNGVVEFKGLVHQMGVSYIALF